MGTAPFTPLCSSPLQLVSSSTAFAPWYTAGDSESASRRLRSCRLKLHASRCRNASAIANSVASARHVQAATSNAHPTALAALNAKLARPYAQVNGAARELRGAELQFRLPNMQAAHRRGGNTSGLYPRSSRRPSREEIGRRPIRDEIGRRSSRGENGRRPSREETEQLRDGASWNRRHSSPRPDGGVSSPIQVGGGFRLCANSWVSWLGFWNLALQAAGCSHPTALHELPVTVCAATAFGSIASASRQRRRAAQRGAQH